MGTMTLTEAVARTILHPEFSPAIWAVMSDRERKKYLNKAKAVLAVIAERVPQDEVSERVHRMLTGKEDEA